MLRIAVLNNVPLSPNVEVANFVVSMVAVMSVLNLSDLVLLIARIFNVEVMAVEVYVEVVPKDANATLLAAAFLILNCQKL